MWLVSTERPVKVLVSPSPQAIVPLIASAVPGSLTLKLRPTVLPAWHAVPVAPVVVRLLSTGDTFDAVYVNCDSVRPPSPSFASTTTVPLPLSVVARLHDQVPSPLSTTAPSPLFFVMPIA